MWCERGTNRWVPKGRVSRATSGKSYLPIWLYRWKRKITGSLEPLLCGESMQACGGPFTLQSVDALDC